MVQVAQSLEAIAQDTFDVIVLAGTLEYAARLVEAENPAAELLSRVKELLKPHGKLYLALNNRLGMQYFAGYQSLNKEPRYRSLEGHASGDANTAQLYSKYEIEALLQAAGFTQLYFYYPYPDYQLPFMIFSDDRLPAPDDPIENRIYTAGEPFSFQVAAALKSLSSTEEQRMFAPAFLIEARVS
jgi:SAM-dependent methyltransferase